MLTDAHGLLRVVLCAIAMFDFARLNRKKAEQRAAENITEDKASAYVDMGDASPLYRFVSLPFLILLILEQLTSYLWQVYDLNVRPSL